jgi:3-(3-hydroxy-phenyl)propionate hydroxylase
MTPNTHGWQLMRDAALSLALTHPFAGALANPRQMTAFTYSESAATLPDDTRFDSGPCAGSVMPEVHLESGYLSYCLGAGFTALCFNTAKAEAITSACGAATSLMAVVVPAAAWPIFDADANSVYLIRPDMHIAARWRDATVDQVIDAWRQVSFQPEADCSVGVGQL